jgi:hypothetical protein
MNRLKSLVNGIIVISSGMMASSLVLTGSEHWKLYLAIFALGISFKIGVLDD